MKLKDVQINEAIIPPPAAAFIAKYGSKVLTFVAIAVLEKLIEKLVKKFFIKKQPNLPDDLFYVGFGYSTKVPRNEFAHAEMIGNSLRQELENKIPTDFSLFQVSDMSKMINATKKDKSDKDIYLLNSFLLGFRKKPNLKDLGIKLKAGFGKLNIQVKITYYGKK